MVLRTRILIAFLILAISSLLAPRLIFAQEQSQSAENNQCLVCHLDVEYLPDDYLEDNIHLKTGLTCASCHGGDSTSDDEEVAKAPEAGFVGVPSKEAIPQFCGKCHSDIVFMRQYQPRIVTDQVDQFYTSVHGIRLREGDEKVADCTSCHTAHGILSARDTRSSVHALNVPQTCNKCHGDSEYMGEYGIRYFGSSPEYGGLIMKWIKNNYELVRRIGSEPNVDKQFGIDIYRHISYPVSPG